MREEHKIKRQGKDYVLFAGLVAEAHAKFTTFTLTAELDKELYRQFPDTPLVQARFTGHTADRVVETTGIGTGGRKGDKSGAAADSPIEMAETRAKARALRVAVNIGETAFEELREDSEDSEDSEAPRRSYPKESYPAPLPRRRAPEASEAPSEAPTPIERGQAAQGRANSPKGKKSKESEAPVKPETLKTLRFHADTFAEMRGDDIEELWTKFIDNLGYPPEEMTEGIAQRWIGNYQKGIKKLEEEAYPGEAQ